MTLTPQNIASIRTNEQAWAALWRLTHTHAVNLERIWPEVYVGITNKYFTRPKCGYVSTSRTLPAAVRKALRKLMELQEQEQ